MGIRKGLQNTLIVGFRSRWTQNLFAYLDHHPKKMPHRFRLTANFQDRSKCNALQQKYSQVIHSACIGDLMKEDQLYTALSQCQNVLFLSDIQNSFDLLPSPNSFEESSQIERSAMNIIKNNKDFQDMNVVKISGSKSLVSRDCILSYGQELWKLEQEWQEATSRCIFLHPNLTMQTLLHDDLHGMICARTISFPLKQAKFSFIDECNVIEFLLKVLDTTSSSNEMFGKSFDLTGSEAYDWNELSNLLHEYLSGKPSIRFSSLPLWVIQPSMWIKGHSPDLISNKIALSKFYEGGGGSCITNTYSEMMQKSPTFIKDFLDQNKSSWPSSSPYQ